MWRSIFFIIIYFLQYVACGHQLCENSTQELSCSKEILGQEHTNYDSCRMEVYPPDSQKCGSMPFGPLSSNTHIGGVTLKPHLLTKTHGIESNRFQVNHTVLNITFSNIKWKTMKFRFQNKNRHTKNHCRNIMISNDVTVNDQSVMYYDCYWPSTDDKEGQSHVLDFEATAEDKTVNRGKYSFNIPSAEMLSPKIKEDKWKPFIYIEIFPSFMRLHIVPPPQQLIIHSYHIKVVTECGKGICDVKSTTKYVTNNTVEVTYDYNFVGANGSYCFVVTPLHDKCNGSGLGCQAVRSPRIMINSDSETLNICVASITALVVATLFAYYIVLRLVRRYWCNDKYKLTSVIEIPTPPKILVIYTPMNRLHAECVASFVTYLRAEYGFDIMYDGDISSTAHKDPYVWAQNAFQTASHVVYIVGPAAEVNLYSNIYDKPIFTAYKNIDTLLLSFLKTNRVDRCPKDIVNVFFAYSDDCVPIEVRMGKKFTLLKDFTGLISHLSKNMLPKKLITRTEKGRSFIDDLTRAEKLLNVKKDDAIIISDKKRLEKKILL